jgi:CPA2 family monovalent cation:H+ antiporter-2
VPDKGSLTAWLSPDTVWVVLGDFVKIAAFVALMLVIGRRVIPWVLHHGQRIPGSRELFRLSVLAMGLASRLPAELFGVSFRAWRLLRRHGHG